MKKKKAKKKTKFTVGASVTISVFTEVEAETPEEAIKIAKNRSVQQLCNYCAGGEGSDEWVTNGSLDGEPYDLSVETTGDEL